MYPLQINVDLYSDEYAYDMYDTYWLLELVVKPRWWSRKRRFTARIADNAQRWALQDMSTKFTDIVTRQQVAPDTAVRDMVNDIALDAFVAMQGFVSLKHQVCELEKLAADAAGVPDVATQESASRQVERLLATQESILASVHEMLTVAKALQENAHGENWRQAAERVLATADQLNAGTQPLDTAAAQALLKATEALAAA